MSISITKWHVQTWIFDTAAIAKYSKKQLLRKFVLRGSPLWSNQRSYPAR